ncbi:hypothetical protein F4778DRAFT_378826 [Xylariomycetidae sp. FL2044]|nr:hypothetical protein F4778DRAFT_378826 [Xylariomycetidae sp. FL2044]
MGKSKSSSSKQKHAAGTASSHSENSTQPPPPGSAPEGYAPARRSPTDSSYYDLDGIPWNDRDPKSQTWIYAREVRDQQSKAPLTEPKRDKYPNEYKNGEQLPFTTPGKIDPKTGKPVWLHQPMIPGKVTRFTGGGTVGGIRTFYTEGDRTKFDVGHHDPRVPTPKGTAGFSLVTYVPAVTHTATPPGH